MLELSFGAGVGPPRRPQARLLFAVSLGFNIVNRRRRFAIGHNTQSSRPRAITIYGQRMLKPSVLRPLAVIFSGEDAVFVVSKKYVIVLWSSICMIIFLVPTCNYFIKDKDNKI